MKIVITVALTLALTGCIPARQMQRTYVPPPERQLVEDKVDRFTGRREISWSHQAQHGLAANYNVAFHDGAKASTLKPRIVLAGTSPTWKYLKCNTTYWLADGKRVEPISRDHDGKVSRGFVVELVSSVFAMDDLRTLANAKSVDYKVCNDEYILYESEMDGLRQFVQAIDSHTTR